VEAHLAGKTVSPPKMKSSIWRAHELNRTWQAEGDRKLRNHALQLLETALTPPLANLDDTGFPGLVLLAASSPAEPAWDRLIGLS
jgi:hypothetical protein